MTEVDTVDSPGTTHPLIAGYRDSAQVLTSQPHSPRMLEEAGPKSGLSREPKFLYKQVVLARLSDHLQTRDVSQLGHQV